MSEAEGSVKARETLCLLQPILRLRFLRSFLAAVASLRMTDYLAAEDFWKAMLFTSRSRMAPRALKFDIAVRALTT
jgi:hypothetical protein